MGTLGVVLQFIFLILPGILVGSVVGYVVGDHRGFQRGYQVAMEKLMRARVERKRQQLRDFRPATQPQPQQHREHLSPAGLRHTGDYATCTACQRSERGY